MLKNLLLLAGFSTFVVVVIIGLNLFHESQLNSLPKTTQKRIKEIPAKFDTDTLNDLKGRLTIPSDITEDSAVLSEDSRTPRDNEDDSEPSITPTQASNSAVLESEEDENL